MRNFATQFFSVYIKMSTQPDEVDVEIGGTAVSGIHQGEEYNKKWATPFGVRKYNKDAFIVIKNQSRRDLTKSQPNQIGRAHV